MGYTNASLIEAGAKYLLSILIQESSIRYSRFYDGSDETSRKIETAIGINDEDRDWYCAAHIIDLAVYELGEQGVVERNDLDETLADGEQDYEIILTEQGRRAVLEKRKLRFWDAE